MAIDPAMELNRAEVVAEVAAAFADYEKALVAGDVAALSTLFWASADVVRFGVADRQRGADQLRAWREAQPPLPAGRHLSQTVVSTFGSDYAVVTTCFSYPGRAPVGRQSQTWVRFTDGWRIVSAHVSQPVGPSSVDTPPAAAYRPST